MRRASLEWMFLFTDGLSGMIATASYRAKVQTKIQYEILGTGTTRRVFHTVTKTTKLIHDDLICTAWNNQEGVNLDRCSAEEYKAQSKGLAGAAILFWGNMRGHESVTPQDDRSREQHATTSEGP